MPVALVVESVAAGEHIPVADGDNDASLARPVIAVREVIAVVVHTVVALGIGGLHVGTDPGVLT
jgi:hypothetical protein